MKISSKELRRIIMEEVAAHQAQKQQLQEGTAERPLKVTAEYLNRIIKEEYEAHGRRQRLAEAKRLRERAEELENL